MFQPKYTITHRLLANIKQITALIAGLNSRSFPRPVLVEMERRARETSAYSSTSIEGNPLPLTEVKRILKNRPEHLRDTEREVINYNQALEALNAHINRGGVRLNLGLILDVQKKITRQLLEPYRCGRWRTESVFVNNPKTGKTVYWPPDHPNVKELMDDLIGFVNAHRKNIDPLILAGLFHKQFVIIHPFIDGNGRTARLATKVILAAMGLNTFNLFSFENYYNRNVSRYFDKVGVLGNYYEIKDKIDFSEWLEYFSDGIIDELLRVTKELDAAAISPQTAIYHYHQAILEHIKKHGYITDKQYSGMTKRARATRNLDFKKLITLGHIQKYGKGKGTYYK